MKYLTLLMVLVSLQVSAQETCTVNEEVVASEVKEDVNTPTPKELEGAQIIVRTKDGKERVMKSDEFKVVKRKQQFKTQERTIVQRVECQPKVVVEKQPAYKKNMIIGGVAKDYVGLDTEVNGNTASIQSRKALVFDIGYMRKNLFDSQFGAGLGLNTNGILRGFVGYEF